MSRISNRKVGYILILSVQGESVNSDGRLQAASRSRSSGGQKFEEQIFNRLKGAGGIKEEIL